jgi:hypothetical protein
MEMIGKLHGHILLEQHDVLMFGPPHGLAVLAKALKGTPVQPRNTTQPAVAA